MTTPNRYPATPQVQMHTPASPLGSMYADTKRLESLHGIIRQKEVQSQAADSLIKELRAQNDKFRKKSFQKQGIRTLDQLLVQAKETEKENLQLRQEIGTLKRIQNQQTKALHDLTNVNDYPTKLRFLTDELRHFKDRVREKEREILEQ